LEDHKMITRNKRSVLSLIVIAGFLTACYLAFTVSAETPSAGKTKKAVQAAEAAAKKAKDAADATILAGIATFGTSYPATDDGKAAAEADKSADAADAAAEDAEKAAAAAREKACKSGNADDDKAADTAETAAKAAEANADAADAAADKADRKADPNGKQLWKRARDAGRAARTARKQAKAAICFALQCAQLMDESSEQNKKKKKETIDTIEGLDSSVDQLALAPQPGGGEVKTSGGLTVVTFTVRPGTIKVNLPDDIRAGDTISGTVIAEPNGTTKEERGANQTELNKFGIRLFSRPEDKPEEVNLGDVSTVFKFALINNRESGNVINVGLVVGTPGNIVSRVSVPVLPMTPSGAIITPDPKITAPMHPSGAVITPDPKITPTFIIPPLGQTGRPIVFTGPFDGNSSNTKLDFQPTVAEATSPVPFHGEWVDFGVIAESPRKAVVTAPSNTTGPMEIRVMENGVQTSGNYRNVGVNLTAPKTSLLKGESTELHVEVNGLQGLTQPVPLKLESHGVITMVGGNYQQFVIQPSQVGADGRYTMTRGITGVQTGGWTAIATVVTHKFDVCLQDDTAPARRILWNTFNGDYIFVCPGCWPPKTGGTTESGGTSTTAGPTGAPGSNPVPPTGLSGTGTMIRKGCILTLTHNEPDRRIFSSLDVCTSSGSATIQDPKTKVKFTLTSRPAPAVTDVSAFATCP
jgi:hypothetical protein